MKAAGMVERVRQEVQIHSRLKHPSVLELFTFFEDDNYVYLVLELCLGGELQRHIRMLSRPLPEEKGGLFNYFFRKSININFQFISSEFGDSAGDSRSALFTLSSNSTPRPYPCQFAADKRLKRSK